MKVIVLILAFSLSVGAFSQSIPITPSIVTFINDSSALICDDSTKLRIDLDGDSISDILIQRENKLRLCTPMGLPPISHQEYALAFSTSNSTVILSRRNTAVFQAIAEEFTPGQIINPGNYWVDNRGYFYLDWIRQIAPTACTTFTDGSMSLIPNIHQFLARKTTGSVDYHFLFALEYSNNNDCYQLVQPRVVGLSSKTLNKGQLSASISENTLSIEHLDELSRTVNYQLYDLSGRLQMEFNSNQTSFNKDVSQLSHGIYLLKVTGEGPLELTTFKLLKP